MPVLERPLTHPLLLDPGMPQLAPSPPKPSGIARTAGARSDSPRLSGLAILIGQDGLNSRTLMTR